MTAERKVPGTDSGVSSAATSTDDLCDHGCGLDATVQHADGRFLCYPCYRVEVEDADIQWRVSGSCPTCSPKPSDAALSVESAHLSMAYSEAVAQMSDVREGTLTGQMGERVAVHIPEAQWRKLAAAICAIGGGEVV